MTDGSEAELMMMMEPELLDDDDDIGDAHEDITTEVMSESLHGDHDNAVAVAFEPEVRFQLAVSIEEDMGRRAVTEVKHIKGVIAEAVGQNPTLETLALEYAGPMFQTVWLQTTKKVCCRWPEFAAFLQSTFAIMAYRTSPTNYFAEPDFFPGGQQDRRMTLERYMTILSALTCSSTSSWEAFEMSFGALYYPFFCKRDSVISVDDDKLRTRANKFCSDTGLSLSFTRGGKPRPVIHFAASKNSGIVLACKFARRGLTPADAAQELVLGLVRDRDGRQTPSTAVFALDRGYSHRKVVDTLSSANVELIGTIQERSTPFASTALPKRGVDSSYWMKRGNLVYCASRSRSSYSYLFSTNEKLVAPGCWVVKEKEHKGDSRWLLGSEDPGRVEFEQWISAREVCSQSDALWHCARRFSITGSISQYCISVYFQERSERGFTNRETRRMGRVLAILFVGKCPASSQRQLQQPPEVRSDEELKEMTIAALKDLAKLHSQFIHEDKRPKQPKGKRAEWAAYVKTLQECEHVNLLPKHYLEHAILEKWFLKPIDPSTKVGQHMAAGLKNEDVLLKLLPEFLARESNGRYCLRILAKCGLCTTDLGNGRIAASPDGVALMMEGGSIHGIPRTTTVELKTSVAASTVASLHELGMKMREEFGACVHCFDLGACGSLEELVTLASELRRYANVDHVGQLMQQMAVLEVDTALYVRGVQGEIVFVAIVKVTVEILAQYREVLHLATPDFVRQRRPPKLHPFFKYGHMADSCSLQTCFRLSEAINKHALVANASLPQAQYVRERIVASWNLMKGGVDVMSRMLKNLDGEFGSRGGHAFIALRFVLIALLNLYHLFRIVSVNAGCLHGKSITAVRRALSCSIPYPSFHRFVVFCVGNLDFSALLPSAAIDAPRIAETSGNLGKRRLSSQEGTPKRRRRLAQRFSNEAELREMRLSKTIGHILARIPAEEGSSTSALWSCAVCSYENLPRSRTTKWCPTCEVPLCDPVSKPDSPCWDIWHSEEDICEAASAHPFLREKSRSRRT